MAWLETLIFPQEGKMHRQRDESEVDGGTDGWIYQQTDQQVRSMDGQTNGHGRVRGTDRPVRGEKGQIDRQKDLYVRRIDGQTYMHVRGTDRPVCEEGQKSCMRRRTDRPVCEE